MPHRTSHLAPFSPLRAALRTSLALLLAGCGPSVATAPTPVTPAIPATPVVSKPLARADATYLLPPAVAYARHLMPLAPTGVPEWLGAHPTWDGRGVLIAILDSGIDPTVPGLQTTSTGAPKLVDLRDFSGEGRVALTKVTPAGGAITVAGRSLTGVGRLLGINPTGPWYAGTLREIDLGEAPASDVNWNNTVGDTLAFIVTKASDGWVLLADLDGDGSLANERPVHDYLVARESFGWAPASKRPSLGFAANFSEQGGEPVLDLYFDNSAHGTHVAGIAAGHDIFGAEGFDGVAPGAELLGLKIANDAQGGISTTGSMLAALDYAIRAASDRRKPLVVNMSFGVGNEQEGGARIDRIIDSVLAAHPDIVFAVSAGNDGPGISTLGFPGSAGRVLSVGATFPRAFLMRDPGTAPDPIAYFSSRGGEVARPDIVTPGVAFSTVPKWGQGDEVKQGTSMASPHAAGLAALLVSALAQSNAPILATRIRQAFVTTAQPIDGLTIIDQGGGVPNVGRAWSWLSGKFRWDPPMVRATGPGGVSTPTAFFGNGLGTSTGQQWQLSWEAAGSAPAAISLRSDVPWLTAPRSVPVGRGLAVVNTTFDTRSLQAPGRYVGTVTAWGADTMAGPVARLVTTIVVPAPPGTDLLAPAGPLQAGLERHWSFGAMAGRPFTARVSATAAKDVFLAFLHEPGGQPFRGGAAQEGSAADGAAIFRVDARDVVTGNYEIVAAAPPISSTSAGLELTQAPFTMVADLAQGTPILALRSMVAMPLTVTATGKIIGGARDEVMSGMGADTGRLTLDLPTWVKRVEIDVQMAADDWPKFTDFGVTLVDDAGRQIEKAPLNYAIGRLSTELPRTRDAGPVTLLLFPGWATSAPGQRWSVTAHVRYYGDAAQARALAPEGSGTTSLGAGNAEGIRFTPAAAPWPLPGGFIPLIEWSATVAGKEPWTLEAPLARAATPLMPGPR